MTKKQIQAAARRFVESHKLHPPVDLKKAVKIINAELVFIEMPKSVSGLVIAPGDGMFLYGISINTKHSYYHQRFTLAHEIGHVMLNHLSGIKYNVSMFSDINNFTLENYIQERDANIFAAEMLIPTPHLKNIVFSSGWRDINSLCRLYQVSEQVISIKLKEIDAHSCMLSANTK